MSEFAIGNNGIGGIEKTAIFANLSGAHDEGRKDDKNDDLDVFLVNIKRSHGRFLFKKR